MLFNYVGYQVDQSEQCPSQPYTTYGSQMSL